MKPRQLGAMSRGRAGRALEGEEQAMEQLRGAGRSEEGEGWEEEQEAFEEPPDEEYAAILVAAKEQEGRALSRAYSLGGEGRQREADTGAGSVERGSGEDTPKGPTNKSASRTRGTEVWNYDGVLRDTVVPNFPSLRGSTRRSKFRF